MYDRAKLLNAIDNHSLEVDKRGSIDKLVDAVRLGAGNDVLEKCRAATEYEQTKAVMTASYERPETLEERANNAKYVTLQVMAPFNETDPPYVDISFGLQKKRIPRGEPVRLSRGFFHALKDAKIIMPVSANGAEHHDPVNGVGVILREVPRFPYQILAVE